MTDGQSDIDTLPKQLCGCHDDEEPPALKELLGQCCGPMTGRGHYKDGYLLAREEAKDALAKAEGR